MKLIETWRADALRLWSVKLALAQAAIGAAATAYAFYTPGGNPWPPILVFLAGLGIAAARLVKQKGVGDGDSE